MTDGFGFDGKTPTPCSKHRLNIANAVIKLVEAHHELEDAKRHVPDYTGQWNDEDYYANEQEAYYRAAERLSILLGN